MYRHIVLYWLRDPTKANLAAARGQLLSLQGKIEGLLSVEVGMDALHSERSCHLCLSMCFASKAALDAYRTHPAHLPIKGEMRQLCSRSHAADYPLPQPTRQMPRLYATLGPACADVNTLCKLLRMGLSGMRLNLRYRKAMECTPWLDALKAAQSQTGHACPLYLQPSPDATPESLCGMAVDGILLPLSLADTWAPYFAGHKHTRLIGLIGCPADMDALHAFGPLAHALLLDRRRLSLHMPAHRLPLITQSLFLRLQAFGIPYGLSSDLLPSMRDKPIPTIAETMDIHWAVTHGATALLLSQETAMGKYPVEALDILKKTAEEALLSPAHQGGL